MFRNCEIVSAEYTRLRVKLRRGRPDFRRLRQLQIIWEPVSNKYDMVSVVLYSAKGRDS